MRLEGLDSAEERLSVSVAERIAAALVGADMWYEPHGSCAVCGDNDAVVMVQQYADGEGGYSVSPGEPICASAKAEERWPVLYAFLRRMRAA